MSVLSRDEFREGVFARDNHKCVICGEPAVDAHHILERRLFIDGGYYLNNGASVCEKHHIECEQTVISVEDIRYHAGITKKVIPPHMYDDVIYDKWGNVIMESGRRLKGELFYDASVQKVMGEGGVLDLFEPYVKYPRTNHLPWSDGIHNDDRVISTMEWFQGETVVVTEKMDGENTSMYCDHIHARSLDSKNHSSRNWVKNYWGKISGEIPEGWRICGENLYAKHSIGYEELPSYFLGFSIWNQENIALSWKETMEWFELLEIEPVKVLYHGIYDEDKIKALVKDLPWDSSEGYILRVADEIPYNEFKYKVAKFVRKNHVQTIKHWMHGQAVVPNKVFDKKELDSKQETE